MSMTAACQSEAALKLPASATVTLVRRTGEKSEESDLVARLRRGDEVAFEVVVRRYGSRLLATARRLLGNEADARDAVQEAFLSAMKGMVAFGGAARLSTWLHRIVVNAALMKLRARRRKREE